MTATNPPLPLEGYTVVDLSGSVATAACGKLFADFGAHVVNVEPPGRGHPTRRLPPHRTDVRAPESSGLHALLSPHKHSVALDVDDAERRAELLGLIAAADVVLESEPPGALASRGLGFERLAERSPRLILTSLTWFGQTGPAAGQQANDAAICCQIGLVAGVGPAEGPPLLPSGHPVQLLGAVTGFAATLTHLLAGVLDPERRAAHVDVSLFEAALCLTEVGAAGFFAAGRLAPRLGLNRFVPTFPGGIYRTAHGWLGVTALTRPQWRSFCELVGLPQLGDDPRCGTTLERLANADKIDELLVPVLLRRSAEEWFHAGQARRLPLALVPSMAELFESEQLRALDAFRRVEHPDLGGLEVPAAPFRLGRTPARRDGPVARLGRDASAGASVRRAARPRASSQRAAHAPLREPAARPQLLRGIRVVDLSMGWAGPLAARHLADMGAEVIKVESRERFDWWRGWDVTPEALAEHAIEKSVAFNTVNRNKLGITLDLASARGAELLLRLVAVSDAVLENYSAAVLPKLGLDEPALRRANPRLVMVSMPPFGAGGPWHSYRAYGSTVEQASGLPHLNGSAGDPPVMLHVALGDPVAGVHGAAALLLAILHKRRADEGQLVDVSQVEALSGLGLHGIASQALLGGPPQRLGSRHPVLAPQGVYPCQGEDRWLMLAVESEAQWPALVRLVRDPALEDAALRTAEGRRARHDAIDERLAAWTTRRERDRTVSELLAAGIPAAGVLRANEVLVHPQLEARGFWQFVERAYVGLQPHPVAPYRAGGGPHGIDWPAPTLGEHNREVLQGLLGLTDAELDALARDGVLGDAPGAVRNVALAR